MTEREESEDRSQYTSAGMAWGMGCSIVASILICVLGGLALDQLFESTPLITLIGVGLGLLLAGYQLWELAQMSSKTGKVGPVARQLGRVQDRQSKRHSGDIGSK